MAQVAAEEEALSTEHPSATGSGVPTSILPFFHPPHHSCADFCLNFMAILNGLAPVSIRPIEEIKFTVRKQWKYHEDHHPISKLVGGPKDRESH